MLGGVKIYYLIIYNNAVVLEVERLDKDNKKYTEVLEAHKIKRIKKEPYIPLEVVDRLAKLQAFKRSKEINVTYYNFSDSNFNLIEFKKEKKNKEEKFLKAFTNRRKWKNGKDYITY